jgi:uncharacterized protein (DUF849 family)
VTAGKRKVIITCVVNGAPRAPSMAPRPAAPPEEIADQAIEAARAGAAILHLPAPADGPRGGSLERILARITAESDAVLSLPATATGRTHPRPELATLSLAAPAPADRPGTAPGDDALQTARDALSGAAGGARAGTRFAFECQDVADLEAVKVLVDEGLAEGPLFLQFGLGTGRWGGGEPESLAALRTAADRLFGRENHEFSVYGNGRQQMAVVTMGAIMGGHVRVGVEDLPHLPRGPSALSGSAQVLKIRRILGELSLPIATPAEAREILRIDGPTEVGTDG